MPPRSAAVGTASSASWSSLRRWPPPRWPT
ncbi:hypothetical protein [Mycobacterium sp. 852002-50816_SCH5313054-b]